MNALNRFAKCQHRFRSSPSAYGQSQSGGMIGSRSLANQIVANVLRGKPLLQRATRTSAVARAMSRRSCTTTKLISLAATIYPLPASMLMCSLRHVSAASRLR